MKYRFEYKNDVYESEKFQDVADYVANWVDENWDLFVEWTNYLVTKDDYEQYIENFIQETIEDVEV